jgi:sulfatase maturation enzyme AslB (radical SAM superfamily)
MPARLPLLTVSPVVDEVGAPVAPFTALDTVWFQLTGTVCNIACLHCFVSCGPQETRVPMMSAADVRRFLDEAAELGAREYYFTGGEPMLHPEFWSLCEAALEVGPLTVLSNGLLIDDDAAARARQLFDAARYSFDLRVSLDGMTAEENDPVRGRGTFDQIGRGIARLAARGLSPTLTVVEHAQGMAQSERRSAFLAFARELGLTRPRVKFLPLLRMGREERRTRGYHRDELDCLSRPLDPTTIEALQCTSARLVTPHGVMSCPILLDAPEARLGQTLRETLRPLALRWAPCRTCIVDGLTCRT